MDEESKAVINAVVHEAAAPFTGVVADLVGVLGGDRLKQFRESKRARQEKNELETVEAAAALVLQRKIEPDPNASPEHVEEILDAAKDCGAAEIRELFARLLASLVDPARSPLYRREFVQIVSQLEPLEAHILPELNGDAQLEPSRREYFAKKLNMSTDVIANAFSHLHKLGLIDNNEGTGRIYPQPIALGRQFLGLVT